ncbi:MAG: hypothetical protein AAFX99_13750 [Myxococcota bacterium]
MTEHNSSSEDGGARRIVDQTQTLGRDAKKVAQDVQALYNTASSQLNLGKVYQDNPYAVLGVALGVGYVLGGGLFTPFSRRLWRIGSRAFVLPLLAAQLRNQGSSSPKE